MKLISLITLFLCCSLLAFSQGKLPEYSPVSETPVRLDEFAQNEKKRHNDLLSRERLSPAEERELYDLSDRYDETKESVWDIIGGGCSWYCGGGNYKITASSSLTSQGKNSYQAKSANDLSYKTAWVEGASDDGIGEYLDYYFENKSPRITSIHIANGYMKSDKAWRENGRVQSLKLYINGVPHCILQLADTKTDQAFEIGTLGRNPDGSALVLRFEILKVYSGDKYSDTAISEIYFDGIDVH